MATWLIAASAADFNWLNQTDVPFNLISRKRDFNDVFVEFNPGFPLFKIEEGRLKKLSELPPLKVPFGNYATNGESFVLFYQKIGTVASKYPLLAFKQVGNKKVGMLVGEGLWRWRLNDYVINGSHQTFDDLITKVVQYLAVKADKSFFRINHDQEFNENETVSFDLQLFNESYELRNDEEVVFELKDENGKTFDYVFSRNMSSYFLDIKGLSQGAYSYIAKTNSGKKSYVEKGEFSVQALQVEDADLKANHQLLFQLSKKTGGALLAPSELDQLLNLLENRNDITAVSYLNEEVEDIINLKWIFFVLMALLTLEWFLRKRNGAY